MTNLQYSTPIKPIIKIVFVILILALISGMAYGSWKFLIKSKPISIPEEPTSAPTTPEPTIQPKPDLMVDWQVYRNEEYKFEIKYPKSWHVYTVSSGLEKISTFSQTEFEKYYGTLEEKKLGETYGFIEISYPKKSKYYASLEELFELMKGNVEKLEKTPTAPFKIEKSIAEEIKISGRKGYRIYYRGKYRAPDYYDEGIFIVYLFLDKDNEGIIRFEGKFVGESEDKGIYEKYAENFNQMLSTFRFWTK